MQVNLDIKNASKMLTQFIKNNGGTEAKLADSLELLAKMCGFESYRALKASADAQKTVKCQASTGWQPIVDKVVHDWEFDEAGQFEGTELPEHRQLPYRLLVEEAGSQLRVLLHQKTRDLDKLEGSPVLDMLVEINDGLPCVHFTNDPYVEMVASVFATGAGLYVRQDAGDWMGQNQAEGELAELIERNGANEKGYAVVHDTATQYDE